MEASFSPPLLFFLDTREKHFGVVCAAACRKTCRFHRENSPTL